MSKYHSVRTGGYDSKREANDAAGFSALARAGKIQDYREQVKFVLVQGKDKIRAITYIADFIGTKRATTFAIQRAIALRSTASKGSFYIYCMESPWRNCDSTKEESPTGQAHGSST